MRIFFILFFINCCYFSQALARQQTTYAVRGIILDKETNEPVIGAAITWNNGKEGAIADLKGKFSFELPTGNYKLSISAVGKKTILKTLLVSQEHQLTFRMENDVQQLSEITVKSNRDVTNLRSATMGVNRLSILEIKKMPPMMGEVDVIKSLITLPGISSIGEGSGGINVRGGSVGQNLVLLDGAPIYFTSHLFGFFSVFNQDVVEDVTLYKGSIPARYGGRVSSVLTVETQNPIIDSLAVSGGLGLVSSRLTVKVPIIKEKLGFLISGRSTYSDWLLKTVNNAQLQNSSASFYDLNSKLSVQFNDKSKLLLSAYHGADQFAFNADTTYQYGNTSATLKHQYEFHKSLNMTSLLTYSNNFSNVFGHYGNQQFDLNIQSENLAAKVYFGAELDQHYIEWGAELNQYDLNPGHLRPSNETSIIENLKVENDYGREWAVFVEDNINFGALKFIAGLRYSHFTKTGPYTTYQYQAGQTKTATSITDTIYSTKHERIMDYGGFEPRFSLNYMLNKEQSFKIGYQRTRQYLHLIANNAAIVPTDIYKLSNEYLKPQIGDQYAVGYFRNFNGGLYETSVELYYKNVQHTIDFKEGANLLLNKLLETELVSANGYAYGAEFSINKTAGDFSGSLNYTYSRAFFQATGIYEEELINNGNPYPAYYDKPHDLTTVLSYQLSRQVSLNVNFTYSTGRPVSVPISKFDIGAIAVAEFSERNQYRIPDYHRMDVSLNIAPDHKGKKIHSSWTLGVYNLYGRKNAFSVFFRDQYGAPPQGYRLAILGIPFPSLTYNFNF